MNDLKKLRHRLEFFQEQVESGQAKLKAADENLKSAQEQLREKMREIAALENQVAELSGIIKGQLVIVQEAFDEKNKLEAKIKEIVGDVEVEGEVGK